MGEVVAEPVDTLIAGRNAKRFRRMVCLWRNAPPGLPPYADCTTKGFINLFIPAQAGKRGRGPQKAPTKVLTTLRLDADVLAYFRAIGRVIAPWGRRIGDLRFETEGQWKRGGTTVESLAKELKLALQYPEGAAV